MKHAADIAVFVLAGSVFAYFEQFWIPKDQTGMAITTICAWISGYAAYPWFGNK